MPSIRFIVRTTETAPWARTGALAGVRSRSPHYDEEVVSTDPFGTRPTFTVDGDSLTVTINDDLSVVEVTRHDAADADR